MPIVIVNNLDDDVAGLHAISSWGGFDRMGLPLVFDRSHAIFIKPNLTYPNFKTGVTTRRDFIVSLDAFGVAAVAKTSNAKEI